jgi:large subunit ribosomal protein LX
MSKVKIFRVSGKITKPKLRTTFQKETRALKPEDALEKVYKEIGSKHRVKRFEIKILKVEEISAEETKSPVIKKLSAEEG